MIERTTTEKVVSSEDFKEYEFGIRKEGLPYVLGILRDKLYSNKILAVIREISCNAWDANVEAGNGKRPIEVTLPNPLDCNFRVRDFGNGLSEDEIADIFINYGESTKRASNRFIGVLGIGSKSPFAYGDNFLVTSYCGKVKTVYNAYIDPSKIGRMAKLSEDKTDEPDGLEIVVPVKETDVRRFYDESVKFFTYSTIKPIVHGVSPVPSFSRINKPQISGEGWSLFGRNETNVAIMGGVPYPLNRDSLHSHVDDQCSELLNHGLELHLKIGEAAVAASRESLEYTEHTIKSIKRHLERILKGGRETFQKNIAEAPTIIEAKRLRKCLPGIFKDVSYTWNGVEITNDYFHISKSGNFEVFSNDRRRKSIRSGPIDSFSCNDRVYVIDGVKFVKRRLRTLFEQDGNSNIITLRFANKTGKDEFKAQTLIDPDQLPNLSSVEPAATISNPVGTRASCFLLNKTELANLYYRSRNANRAWESTPMPTVGVYCRIERFRPIDSRGVAISIDSFRRLLLSLEKFVKTPEIYGLTLSTLRKNPNIKLTSLWDWVSNNLQKYIKKNKIKFTELSGDLQYIDRCFNKEALPPDHPIVELLALKETVHNAQEKNSILKSLIGTLQHLGLSIAVDKEEVSLSEEEEKLMERYPMLKLVNADFNKRTKLSVDYVQSMDRTVKNSNFKEKSIAA